jgi:hypothetical protein
MTCKDFHNDWEGGVGRRTDVRSESTEMAEHAGACPECGGFVRDEAFLEKQLDRVRAAAPMVPPSLDSKVIENYRRYLAKRPVAIDRPRWRVSLENALPWAAALAFAALVAYGTIVFFMPHASTGWVHREHRTPVGQPPVTAEKPVSPPVTAMGKAHRLPRRAPTHRENIEAEGHGDDSIPRAFESLVYCDQISCPGAMEVIRVQLPTPVLGFARAPAPAGGMVSADVLVGADGIARGIRVVE